MNYIFALMHLHGHAAAQIIDPVTKKVWLGIDFYGNEPRTPQVFTGDGAIAFPITKHSAEALRDTMDQLKLTYEGGKTPQSALEDASNELYQLATQHTEDAQVLLKTREDIRARITQKKKYHMTLIDEVTPVAVALRALAEEIRPRNPALADAIADPNNPTSIVNDMSVSFTPYYDANLNVHVNKYERAGKNPLNFTGAEEAGLYLQTERFERPADSVPLVGTNCLHFIVNAAQHIAGIPLTRISQELDNSFNVGALGELIEEGAKRSPARELSHINSHLETLENGTPVAYVRSDFTNIEFPEIFGNIHVKGQALLDVMATSRHPLYDRQISHAVMQR